jgi:polar amino acid transport system substrate-binding protein
METDPVCPNCRAPLAADAPAGLCARCLLQGGLAPAPAAGSFTPPSVAELAPLFPQLEIVGLLGCGGMGAVYKARQPALDRLVALKILPKELGRDPSFAERFAREARALAKLDHPHIVTVYDCGTSGGYPYLLMEYVDGNDLRHALRERTLAAGAALRVVTRACEALQYAREQGVIHRDIKPENILLTRNGGVKLADFGLAKLLGDAGDSLTADRQVMGTRHYMAPEQEEAPQTVDHRADVYSVGVVCYELLTGELPLGQFAPPSHKAKVDPRIDAVVLKALAREPGRRFQSAGAMKEAIEAATGKRRTFLSGRWIWPAVAAASVALILMAVAWRAGAKPVRGDELRWGGDASGGAPYIIEGEGKSAPTGFEAELAEYLAGKLGLRPKFVPRSWEMLPQDLDRGSDIDVILNGYEWWPERERTMASTIPYYVCKIQLVVRPGSPVRDWADLHRGRSGKQLRVGVLSESSSHRYVKKTFAEDEVKVIDLSEEGITGVLTMVRQGNLDATVIDAPAALWYIGQKHGFEDLSIVGQPIEPCWYVMYCRPGDVALREGLNDALRAAERDGTLRKILDKYGLWNDDQNELLFLSEHWPPQSDGASPSEPALADLLARAAGLTVVLACLSMPLAIILGLLVAVGRLYGPRWLGWFLTFYVELLRGTPLLMQLLVIYYFLVPTLLHAVGLPRDLLNEFWSSVLALAINYSAYEAENYRAGIQAIPRGQTEAALALGMGKWTALRRVVIPQAVRVVIPPVTNDFIALFKDTSICSVIAVHELAYQYRNLSQNYPRLVMQAAVMTAILYLAMSWPLSLLARRLERRFNRVTG